MATTLFTVIHQNPTQVFATHTLSQQIEILDAYPADQYDVYSTTEAVTSMGPLPATSTPIRVAP